MLLWGGGSCSGDRCDQTVSTPRDDGAALDPSANRWRSLAKSPLSARLRPASAWTGKELVVWGGQAGTTYFADGAAYDPASDRWRPMAWNSRFAPASVWTSQELIVWGGIFALAKIESLADGARLSPYA